MNEPIIPPVRPRRTGLIVAVGITAVALPLLVIDNLPGGDDAGKTVSTVQVVAPESIPADRPESGPIKGFSVVTSSTTSSTLPITTSTTRPT